MWCYSLRYRKEEKKWIVLAELEDLFHMELGFRLVSRDIE